MEKSKTFLGITNGLEGKYSRNRLSNGLEGIFSNRDHSIGSNVSESGQSFEAECHKLLDSLRGDEAVYRAGLAFVESCQAQQAEPKEPVQAQIAPNASQQLTLDHLRILTRLSQARRR